MNIDIKNEIVLNLDTNLNIMIYVAVRSKSYVKMYIPIE